MLMRSTRGCCALALGLTAGSACAATNVTITIENLAPTTGVHITPTWFGAHDGTFDLFNVGSPASMEVERLAEDGNVMPLRTAFAAANPGFVDEVAFGPTIPPIGPGESSSVVLSLDETSPLNRFLSYGAMIVPSNDAFIGNDNPTAHQIFTPSGQFIPQSFIVLGTDIWDAGTEVNDEIPANTAFFGQSTPNTGVDENGVVHQHPGYIGSIGNPGGTPSILADPDFGSADFTKPGYRVARVTVVPAPWTLAGFAPMGLLSLRRRWRAGR